MRTSSEWTSPEKQIISTRWAIQKLDNGALLSKYRSSDPTKGADFLATAPCLFSDARAATEFWTQWLIENGYLKRRISTPGDRGGYKIVHALPRVRCVRVTLTLDGVSSSGAYCAE